VPLQQSPKETSHPILHAKLRLTRLLTTAVDGVLREGVIREYSAILLWIAISYAY
jgi:hypothetical protein